MALACPCFPTSFLLLHTLPTNHHSSRHHLFVCFKSLKPFSVSATPLSSTSYSSSPVFLPFLQQQDEEEEQQQKDLKLNIMHKEPKEGLMNDPILQFLQTRSSTQGPHPEGKFSLQRNRRSSWHLDEDLDSTDGWESDVKDGFEGEEEESGFTRSSSSVSIEGIPGEILQTARNLPQNSTLGEFLGPIEGRIGPMECLDVFELMGQEGLVMGCLQFFEWMRVQEPSLLTPRACSILFLILGRVRMGDELMVLFRSLQPAKQLRDVHVYNAAISGLLCCGRYGDALNLYDEMERDNVQPDHVTCSVMITTMRKNGQSAKDAWEFFQRMNRKGVCWSLEVLVVLTKSFCDEGLKKEALLIQIEMEKNGILPNAVVYNTLMDAYSKSNHVEEAEGLFSEMKVKGIEPTTTTYNTLMDAYSRRMQPEIIEKLLLEMESEGLKPNAKSYTCLISAYGRQKKMSEMAADVFLRMKKEGIKPTSHSYTALIHAYSISGWHEKAFSAFENMQKEGLRPSIETYTALLDAFRRAGDTKMLLDIWKSMIGEEIEGTRVTFNILVDGFAKQGHYTEARDVISKFGKIGLQPTVMTYNMLMNAYARGGQDSRLPQLLKEMAALNLKPDSCTYCTMIYAFLRVCDFRRAFFYHKQMVKSGQVPDARSYRKLRALLDAKAKTSNRKDRSAMLGIVRSVTGMLKPKKKGSKDEFWKNKKQLRVQNFGR